MAVYGEVSDEWTILHSIVSTMGDARERASGYYDNKQLAGMGRASVIV